MEKEKEEFLNRNDNLEEMETTFVDPEDLGPNSTVIIGGGDPNLSPTAGNPLI